MARPTRDDMTSSALVALMEISFERQRLDLARTKIRTDGAHASLDDKVAVGEAVLRAHGPGPLLQVGASIGEMARDPLAAALLAAHNGRDLFDRWQRLERYVHTRHPIVMCDMTAGTATLDHRGNPDDPPSVAINFILAGLFAHLLRAIGCQDVALMMGTLPQTIPFADEKLEAATEQSVAGNSGVWHYRWAAAPGRCASAELEVGMNDRRGRKLSDRLLQRIESDLLQTWTLARAASTLTVSQRTLQRRLRNEGVTLSGLRRRAQIEQASRHLLTGTASLSSIGYASGFSDLPHFTREFRKRVGMPPSAFRALCVAEQVEQGQKQKMNSTPENRQ